MNIRGTWYSVYSLHNRELVSLLNALHCLEWMVDVSCDLLLHLKLINWLITINYLCKIHCLLLIRQISGPKKEHLPFLAVQVCPLSACRIRWSSGLERLAKIKDQLCELQQRSKIKDQASNRKSNWAIARWSGESWRRKREGRARIAPTEREIY